MKLNINSGRKGNSTYTFSPVSLVTLDYGRLQPIMTLDLLLGDKFPSWVGKGLLRCTPQIFPPFGRMNLKSASFFVPDSQIYSWSSAFHSDNKLWRGQIADKAPSFLNYEMNRYFITNNFISQLSTLVSNNPASVPARNSYDFVYPVNSGRAAGNTNLDYYKLTPKGWKIYAIFKALGYDFVTFPTDTAASLTFNDMLAACRTDLSSVAFLAYSKLWNDYYCNSYQSDKNPVSSVLQNIYLNKDVVLSGFKYYDSTTFMCDFHLFMYMLQYMSLPYESNMYTNAWNNPNDPTGVENGTLNQVGSQSLISPFGSNGYGEFGTLSASSLRNEHGANLQSGVATYFSELGHKTLESFDRFVRRRNLVGSKAVQQLYALFGIEPDEWKKDYVVKLSENSSRVNFSAITSQSDTENGATGKPLGAFAGIGLGGYDISFSYEANTYGTLVCLAWLNIDPIIMHGCAPHTLRVKPLDFYNPDFDGKAYRPIPYCEITGAKSLDANLKLPVSVYGYTNMYDDYRTIRDVVAGNFLDDTTKHFAFMRDLTETRNDLLLYSPGSDIYPQSTEVQYWQLDGSSDITNPFITAASAGDRFWFCVDWNIQSTRPILSSENSFDLDGEGNISVNKNGDGMA